MTQPSQEMSKRLFVGVDFPTDVVTELARIRPRPVSGIRPVNREQLHLTLHFVGDVNLQQISDSLELVAFPKFSLTISGVGEFRGRDGSLILWAGINSSPELMLLYTVIGEALKTVSFTPESRPYSPHITLARCKQLRQRAGDLMNDEAQRFLASNTSFLVPEIPIQEFTLYSSIAVPGGREYCRERSYGLTPTQGMD